MLTEVPEVLAYDDHGRRELAGARLRGNFPGTDRTGRPPVMGDAFPPRWKWVDVMSAVQQAAEQPGSRGQPPSDSEPADGRAARSHRSRRAIVDAMRALHAEGDLRPTAPRVAGRAGVSLRTVWQQFADMETLLVEANRRDDEILRSLMEQIDPDQPLAARVVLFTGQRARILEQMTPSWRAARLFGPFSEELRRNKVRTLAMGKADLETVFAPELTELAGTKRQQLLDGLHAVSIWSFWESLRTELSLDPRQAEELLRATFTALLAGAGFP
jgi:TetR/AcrR family transcriptional regulator, regulator of autoinduction and epiphytic fitness